MTATSATASWPNSAFSTSAGYVLAAGDDHVLHAVVDVEITLVVEIAGIAGVEPAVADGVGGGLRAVPVAFMTTGWRITISPGIRAERLAGAVADFDVDTGVGLAAGAQLAGGVAFGGQAGARARGLGEAVQAVELAAEDVLGGGEQILGDGRGAVEEFLQRAEIARPDLRMLSQEEDHGRHEQGVVHPVTRDVVEDLVRIDFLHDEVGRALGEREHAHVGPGDMEHRHAGEGHAAGFEQAPARLLGDFEQGTKIRVAELYALRMPRGAAGIELDDVVLGREGQRGVVARCRIAPGGEHRPGSVRRVHRDDAAQAGAACGERLGGLVVLGADEQQFATGVVQDARSRAARAAGSRPPPPCSPCTRRTTARSSDRNSCRDSRCAPARGRRRRAARSRPGWYAGRTPRSWSRGPRRSGPWRQAAGGPARAGRRQRYEWQSDRTRISPRQARRAPLARSVPRGTAGQYTAFGR